jgi:hypothetical protein
MVQRISDWTFGIQENLVSGNVYKEGLGPMNKNELVHIPLPVLVFVYIEPLRVVSTA